MSSLTGTLRAYLELSRLSNIPTVLTNVLVGVGLAGAIDPPPWIDIAIITLAMMLLYVAGMALNDVMDARIDAHERPGRPIPSGRVTKRGAMIFIGVCFASGVAMTIPYGGMTIGLAAALVATIVAYDFLHKRFVGSVVLMGACRALVYLTAAAALTDTPDWQAIAPPAIAMLVYIALLTIIASVETHRTAGWRSGAAFMLPFPIVALAVVINPPGAILPIACGTLFLGWTVASSLELFRPNPRIGKAVLGWLAGICLADAFVLALLGATPLILVALVCFAITVAGHRLIMGT